MPDAALIGQLAAGLTGVLGLGISFVAVPFISPAFRRYCLPYVPATDQQVENVTTALQKVYRRKINSSKDSSVDLLPKVVDLGSGDGRIVTSLAKLGYHATGVELNYWLVLYSRLDALRLGVRKNATFLRKDLWKVHLADYNAVVLFGAETIMDVFEHKCLSDLRNNQNCMVFTCRFPLATQRPVEIVGEGIDTVWVYKIS